MRTTFIGIAGALIAVGLTAGFLIYKGGGSAPAISVPASQGPIHYTDGVEAWYTNDAPPFSFRLPDGFTAPNGPVEGGKEIFVKNDAGVVLRVLALAIATGKDNPLTEDIVRANVGDAAVSDFRPAMLADGVGGLAFSTADAAWDGDGVAFWFIHDGYLYELSTARKDADLLSLLMQTLTFPGDPTLVSPS
jgi:hypothetical protein